jgi:PAS domain S-box-containing protein
MNVEKQESSDGKTKKVTPNCESYSDQFLILGFNGAIQTISPAFSIVTGYLEMDIIAVQFFHFVHPEERVRVKWIISRLSKENGEKCFQARFRKKPGQYISVNCRATTFHSKVILFLQNNNR